MSVSGHLHVFFPRGRTSGTRLARAGVTGGCGPELGGSSSHREPLQELSVESEVQLLRPSHTHQVVLVLPTELDLDQVFPINRKIVSNGDAAP